jgi:hypothetical protein
MSDEKRLSFARLPLPVDSACKQSDGSYDWPNPMILSGAGVEAS